MPSRKNPSESYTEHQKLLTILAGDRLANLAPLPKRKTPRRNEASGRPKKISRILVAGERCERYLALVTALDIVAGRASRVTPLPWTVKDLSFSASVADRTSQISNQSERVLIHPASFPGSSRKSNALRQERRSRAGQYLGTPLRG